MISIDDTPPPPATTIHTIPQTLPTPQSTTDHTHQTESVHFQHEGSSPLSSIPKNSSPEQYQNIINHHHYTSPATQTSNQTETKYLSSFKILTLNVRGVFTNSQHDLKHMIANTPYIMVLTETKLQKGNKPQPWLHSLLTNYKWWTSTTKRPIHQLENVIMALEDAKLFHKDIYALIVDLTSAFNTTDHDRMLWIMYDLGFPNDAIDAVKNLYEDATIQVKLPSGVCTGQIPVERGTIQGETLSPFLFLLYI